MSNIFVSIVIVSAGKKDFLDNLLESIKKQSYVNREVIIIDNLHQKMSYCDALNKGIDTSKGDFILCLNDDIILDSRFMEEALRGFSKDDKIGMVSGKILRFDKSTIDSAGLFLSLWRTAGERGYGAKDKGQFEKEGYIFGVTGAAAFYRREMLEDIKLVKNGDSLPSPNNTDKKSGMGFGRLSPFFNEYFDSRYCYFYEDLDVAWRAQRRGWKGYYVPTAVAYHLRGGTARQGKGINRRFARRYINDELHMHLIKNRYLTIIRNENFLGFLLHLPFIVIYDIILWAYILLFRFKISKKFVSCFWS